MAAKKGGLGRGLDSLFADNSVEEITKTNDKLRITALEPNLNQPRKYFDETMLTELSESISKQGLLTPILVRPLPTGSYQIVAGERRWRAARIAGLEEVPVIIRDLSDEETIEISMVENLQREDLNPIEEALGYKNMMDKLNITQEETAERLGKSRPAVTNSLRLLKLPDEVQEMVYSKKISTGHARALLGLDNDEDILRIAKLIISKGISVRDVESIVKKSKKEQKVPQTIRKDKFFSEVELALINNLGRKIKIKENGKKESGTLEIEFFDKEDLESLAMKLENYGK